MGRRTLVAGAVLVAAAGFAFGGQWPWQRLSTPPVRPLLAPSAPMVVAVEDTLRRGETVSALFARHGVSGLDLGSLLPGIDPRRLPSGLVVHFMKPAPEAPASAVSLRANGQRIQLEREAAAWHARTEPVVWHTEHVRLTGTVDYSIADALDASTPDSIFAGDQRARLVWDLADVFAWQADFSHDMQPGDRVTVLVERRVADDGEVRAGRILAADLSVGRKRLSAYAYARSTGDVSFYDASGLSLHRAFLAAPVQFRRISSSFSTARFHPVLGITRRHEGTDYAAFPGTPVMAVADGRVERAGWAGGYGNLVELVHPNGITTRYGHLSRIAPEARTHGLVHQGDVIGYVGATGLATGPHLHYEFRVGGIARDATKLDLGGGEPIAAAERPSFEAERARLDLELHGPPAIATAEPQLRLRGQ
jgi:murein DD-endopeptidase MepM/ murein hydrolase activator NlpD